MEMTIGNNHSSTHHHDYPTLESNIIITTILALFLVIGFAGSFLTAVIIAAKKQLHTNANLFIFSLCISDLISALICSPLWTYRRTWGFQLWKWGDFACKFYWVTDYSTNYITSLHIVSFAMLRYAAVKYPLKMAKISKRFLMFYIGTLWLIAVLASIPLGFLMGVDYDRESALQGSCWPSCSIASKKDCCIPQYSTYISVINPMMFYVPEILIIVFSLLICYEIKKKQRWRKCYLSTMQKYNLCRTPPPSKIKTVTSSTVIKNPHASKSSSCASVSEDVSHNLQTTLTPTYENSRHSQMLPTGCNDSRAFYQLSLIVIAYAIGYIPVTVYLQWSVSTPKAEKAGSVDYWFGVVSYLFLRFSECMNPLMYNLGSTKIKTETKKVIKKLFLRKSVN